MNTNQQEAAPKEFMDADFDEYTPSGGEYSTVPTNWYNVVIEDLTAVKKSDNKVQSDLRLKQQDHPDATIDDIDKYQWAWSLRIDDGEWQGEAVVLKTSRSLHENSIAGKLAAAALGLKKWDKAAAKAIAQAAGKQGTAVLMGRRLRASVTEDKDAQDRMWNNSKQFEPYEPPRARAQKPVQPIQKATVPYQALPGYPQAQDDDLDPVGEF